MEKFILIELLNHEKIEQGIRWMLLRCESEMRRDGGGSHGESVVDESSSALLAKTLPQLWRPFTATITISIVSFNWNRFNWQGNESPRIAGENGR